jgi:hypothetical protein
MAISVDKTEIRVENHIRKIIKDKIIVNNPQFEMLDNKDVFDILICDNGNPSKIFFIEVKHYSAKNNRMDFGGSNGNGYQPEILTKQPKYFEERLIWVFLRENDDNYYVLKNADCQNYLSGGSIGVKQNNFQTSLFNNITPLSENDFLRYIENWLKE